MDFYLQALRNTAKSLEVEFDKSTNINHSATKGIEREHIIKKLIRPFLPDIYGLSSGECFSKDNTKTKQLDLIIYDVLYSYRIPYGNYIQFPCESVYGNIEVKSFLNKEEFDISIKNIESLKKLKREKTNFLDITPYFKLNLYGPLDITNKKCTNEYLGIVFSYDSCNIDTILSYIDTITTDKKLLPDFFVIYKKNTIIFKIKNNSITFKNDFDGYAAINTGIDTMPLFIGVVLSLLKQKRLKACNIEQFTINLLDSQFKDNSEIKVKYLKNH